MFLTVDLLFTDIKGVTHQWDHLMPCLPIYEKKMRLDAHSHHVQKETADGFENQHENKMEDKLKNL